MNSHPPNFQFQIAEAKEFIKHRFVTRLASRAIPYKVRLVEPASGFIAVRTVLRRATVLSLGVV